MRNLKMLAATGCAAHHKELRAPTNSQLAGGGNTMLINLKNSTIIMECQVISAVPPKRPELRQWPSMPTSIRMIPTTYEDSNGRVRGLGSSSPGFVPSRTGWTGGHAL